MKNRKRDNDKLVSPMIRAGGTLKIKPHEPAPQMHGLEKQTAMAAIALENSSAAHAAICDAEFVRRAMAIRGRR